MLLEHGHEHVRGRTCVSEAEEPVRRFCSHGRDDSETSFQERLGRDRSFKAQIMRDYKPEPVTLADFMQLKSRSGP